MITKNKITSLYVKFYLVFESSSSELELIVMMEIAGDGESAGTHPGVDGWLGCSDESLSASDREFPLSGGEIGDWVVLAEDSNFGLKEGLFNASRQIVSYAMYRFVRVLFATGCRWYKLGLTSGTASLPCSKFWFVNCCCKAGGIDQVCAAFGIWAQAWPAPATFQAWLAVGHACPARVWKTELCPYAAVVSPSVGLKKFKNDDERGTTADRERTSNSRKNKSVGD